jgi:hypothetical protein
MVAVCVVLFAECALPMGLEYLAGARRSSSASTTISGEDLSRYIAAPVTGRAPALSFAAPRYTGTVEWMEGATPLTGDFAANTEYTAAATLYAFEGYAFEVPAAPQQGSFSYNYIESGKAELFHNSGTSKTLEVLISFEATGAAGPEAVDYVVDYDLQHYVPIPVTGAAPVTAVSRPDLSVAVRWQDERGEDLAGLSSFVQGARHRAVITLTARSPYRFSADIPFAYAGGAVETQPDPGVLGVEERIVSVGYLPTAAPVPAVPAGEALDLAPHLLAPAAGESPTRYFGAAGYTGTVVWKLGPDFAGEMPGNLFQAERLYRAEVVLYAAPGHTLAGVSVVHSGEGAAMNGAGEWENAGSSLTGVKVSFPETGKLVISGLDLAVYIPAPVANGQPALSFAGSQYLGLVSWQREGAAHEGLFEAGAKYTAAATLTAVSGYKFGPEHIHSRAERVIHIDSGNLLLREVEIEFPVVPAGSLRVSGISGAVNVTARVYLSDTEISPVSGGGHSASDSPAATGELAGPAGPTAAIPLKPPAGGSFTGDGNRVIILSFIRGGVVFTYAGQAGARDQRVLFTKGIGETDLGSLTRLGGPYSAGIAIQW